MTGRYPPEGVSVDVVHSPKLSVGDPTFTEAKCTNRYPPGRVIVDVAQ